MQIDDPVPKLRAVLNSGSVGHLSLNLDSLSLGLRFDDCGERIMVLDALGAIGRKPDFLTAAMTASAKSSRRE